MPLSELQKNTRKRLTFHLEKREIRTAHLQVGLACDVSGSTHDIWGNGSMQMLMDRVFPIAERFDDNGQMDIRAFSDRAYELPDMTRDNFSDYARRYVIGNHDIHWGGTIYESALRSFVDEWFSPRAVTSQKTVERRGIGKMLFGKTKIVEQTKVESRKHQPSYIVFNTDGIAHDTDETMRFLSDESQKGRIFISFIGVGNPKYFDFLRHCAELFPNVDFMDFADLSKMSDDSLYEGLISDKLARFLKDGVHIED